MDGLITLVVLASAGLRLLLLHALNLRPDRIQLLLDFLVAPIDVVDAVDAGRAAGDELHESAVSKDSSGSATSSRRRWQNRAVWVKPAERAN